MADTYTETTTRSWGGRLKDSIGGFVFGLVLFLASFVILFWNESNSVKVYKAIAEMEKNVVTVDAAKVDSTKEGMLVHMSGTAATEEILSDKLTGLKKTGIALSRSVEMYQWVEHQSTQTKEKLGGGEERVTTYSYEKKWNSSGVQSSSFKIQEGHSNPVMQYAGGAVRAGLVKLGAYRLNAGLIAKISGSEELPLSRETTNKFPASFSKGRISGGVLYFSGTGAADPDDPKVGDYRMSFSYIAPKKEVSIMAKQLGGSFEPYTAKNGKSFEILKMGLHSADAIITMERKANALMTWILRFVGFLAMLIGLKLLVNPLRTVLAVLPPLAKIFGAITGFVLFIVAAVLSLVTIAIAWFAARPVLGVIILVAAGGLIILLLKNKGNKQAAVPPTPQQ